MHIWCSSKGLEKDRQALLVWRRQKSRHGLKQIPQIWYHNFISCLEKLGLNALHHFYCFSFKTKKGKQTCVVVYADGLLIMSRCDRLVSRMKQKLVQRVNLKSLCLIKDLLGLKITKKTRCFAYHTVTKSKFFPRHGFKIASFFPPVVAIQLSGRYKECQTSRGRTRKYEFSSTLWSHRPSRTVFFSRETWYCSSSGQIKSPSFWSSSYILGWSEKGAALLAWYSRSMLVSNTTEASASSLCRRRLV